MPGLWDWATNSVLPDEHFKNKYIDSIYNDILKPYTNPLTLAGGVSVAPRIAKYLKRGLELPKAAANIKAGAKMATIPATIRDEVKQLAMTFGLPGTGINAHSVSLAAAHLKGTPLKELPKEAYETARMMWNPERAVKANEALTGGKSPNKIRDMYTAAMLKMNPKATTQQLNSPVESFLDMYGKVGPAAGSRFDDILNLERRNIGNLKTADALGGTSKGVAPTRQILTKPIPVMGKNMNPMAWAKEMFDEPTFGEDYLNTYFKRKTALNELDRARQTGVQGKDAFKQAADFATTSMGGYGADNPSKVFSNDLARWGLTAPDWTRRHFDLAGKKIASVTKEISNPKYAPYRRYLGYDVAGLAGTMGINKLVTGHYTPDRAQDMFGVQLPQSKKDSKVDVVRPYSSEMDLPSMAADVSNSLVAPGWHDKASDSGIDSVTKFARNRIHPATKSLIDIVMNRDWQGHALYGKENFSKPSTDVTGTTTFEQPRISLADSLGRVGKDIQSNITPQSADTISTLMSGNKTKSGKRKLSPISAFSQMFELPVRSYTPPYSRKVTPLDREMAAFKNEFKKKK